MEDDEEISVDHSALMGRAWVTQEWRLPRRRVQFLKGAIVWSYPKTERDSLHRLERDCETGNHLLRCVELRYHGETK